MNKSDLHRCKSLVAEVLRIVCVCFFPPVLNFAVRIAVQNEVGESVVERLESVCVNRPSVRQLDPELLTRISCSLFSNRTRQRWVPCGESRWRLC
jgi:hypothetical protein